MTEPSAAVVPRIASQLDEFARLGRWLEALESDRKTPEAKGAAAALRFYYARELDLPPTAVAEISVIKGHLFIGAQLMRALAERAGYRVARVNDSATSCTAQLIRVDSGEIVGETTVTIEDARAAGWIRDGSGWQKTPGRMLWARSSSYVIRDYAPEVTLGMSTDDEIADVTGEIVQEVDLGPVAPDRDEQPGQDEPQPEPFVVPEPPVGAPISRGQQARMQELFRQHGLGGDQFRDQRHAYAAAVVGRDLESSADLTAREALWVIDALRQDLPADAPEPPSPFQPPPDVRERLDHSEPAERLEYGQLPEGY